MLHGCRLISKGSMYYKTLQLSMWHFHLHGRKQGGAVSLRLMEAMSIWITLYNYNPSEISNIIGCFTCLWHSTASRCGDYLQGAHGNA